VITIHNSSLASQRVGFSRPTSTAVNNGASTVNDQNNPGPDASASTPDQIQAAIKQTGLPTDANFPQESSRRANQALQAYNQTRNHPIQAQLENLISRVDYYA